MPRTATAAEYTYLDCPTCGAGIAEPFAVTTGPRTFVHQHGYTRCRLAIWPDPHGDDHRIWPIPDDTSLETVNSAMVRFARKQGFSVHERMASPPMATAA